MSFAPDKLRSTLDYFPTVWTYSAKPGLTPSAPLVPGLHSYDTDLTLRTN